jgi:hypothetical protein
MDELDEERSSGQVIAAASAAAGLLGALALALTRKKDLPATETGAAMGVAAKPSGGSTGPDFAQVVDQVAEVAPELVAALDTFAPEVSKQIRRKLPLVRAFGGASLADAVEYGKRPSRLKRAEMGIRAAADKVEDRVVDVAHEAKDRADETLERAREKAELDLSSLSAAQAAAAQAAIAAVSKAENAFGAGERFGIHAGKGASESIQPLIRDVAQQAATLALDLWQNARTRTESAADEVAHRAARDAAETRHAAGEALGIAKHTASAAGDDLLREAHAARERAERAQHEAEAALRELREAAAREVKHAGVAPLHAPEKKSGGIFSLKFMWFASLLGLAFYVFLDEERRKETSFQVKEILRDLRGYDDEF